MKRKHSSYSLEVCLYILQEASTKGQLQMSDPLKIGHGLIR